MLILGIETSCDETAAAVVRGGREVLSNVVYSQIPLHQAYGGVVPEIASRSHLEKLPGVIREAMGEVLKCGSSKVLKLGGPPSPVPRPPSGDGIDWGALDAIAVTYGPGLASSLIVGLSAAKGLAMALGKPLIGINHLEAHIHSVFLNPGAPPPHEACPMLALVVSGGHTCWVDVPRVGQYRVIGQTLDDAAGEAFDKAAKLLGLGYPGGPAIDRVARQAARTDAHTFPRGAPRPGNPALGEMRAEMCVSFSGLKTSLMYHLRDHPPLPEQVPEIAAAYQEAIVGALADRCDIALTRGMEGELRHFVPPRKPLEGERPREPLGGGYRSLAVGGGVSLNGRLRERLAEVAAAHNVNLLLAAPKDCGDNAAMIAGLSGMGCGVTGEEAFLLDAVPALEIGNV